MMKRYTFQDTALNRCLLALFLLAMLMLSRDSAYGRSVIGFLPSQLGLAGLLVLGGLYFLWAQRRNLRQVFTDSRLLAAGIIALLFLIPMVLKRDWQLMYFSILLYIFLAVFVHYFADLRQLSRYYVVILAVLGAYSVLATYFLRILPDRGILNVPVFGREGDGLPFYQFGLCVVSLEFVASRNFGIFREPGVYQFFLLLGLLLNNYRADWKKPWQLWTINGILALTMLSTFATGGIIELGLLVLFLFWDKKWYRSRKARMLAYGAVLALAAAIGYVLVTKNSLYMDMVGVFGKFADDTNETGSSRIGSIVTDIRIFLQHPLLGDTLRTVLHTVQNNTTSTMIQYAAFGAVTGSLHVLAWGALVWDKNRCAVGNILLLIIMMMSFNTQNLIGDPIFWLFPIGALLDWVLPWAEEKRKRKEVR